MNIYDFNIKGADGNIVSMSQFTGKALLIVNTASRCGFTPQYDSLQKLYSELNDRGLEILGFPCNQFLNQDPGTDEEIQQFCRLNFGVTFPVFAKIDVNGPSSDPLFSYLKSVAPGFLGSKKIKWNFTKFLVDRTGKVVKRYSPATDPGKIRKNIIRLL